MPTYREMQDKIANQAIKEIPNIKEFKDKSDFGSQLSSNL
jgi:hypothetical protein